ncbi:MAG: sigma-70 family RNA polymerase sigma factor [Rubripirellula sp.]|nr:sigma-70 family RNA polymerase sigma factor [Rubripirellula sp.]
MSELNLAPEIVERMRGGDPQALADVFSHFRQQLERIVRFRLDYRLAARVSDSDVMQETFIAAAKRLDHFSNHPEMPPFLWLRLIVGQQLIDLHRRHFKTEMRDIRKEVSLQQTISPNTSLALAAKLAGPMISMSEIVAQAERIERLETVLNEMDPIDREVIALRHFEELSNLDTAQVLGIKPSASSKRYLRAMTRLGELMKQFHADEDVPEDSKNTHKQQGLIDE